MKSNAPILLILVAATLSGHTEAAIVASANFTGMSGANQTSVGTSSGANDFTWSLLGNGTPNLDLVSDTGSPGIGSGIALQMDGTNTNNGLLGTFGTTNLAVGHTITLSFTGRYTAAPATSDVAGLRFGFVDPNDLDNAFGAYAGTAGSTNFSLHVDNTANDSPLSGANTPFTTTTVGAYATLNHNNPFSFQFSIARTGSSTFSLSSTMGGATVATSTDATSGWTSYNRIFIRNGNSTNVDFIVDSVDVAIVPEPSATLLGGIGALGLLRRRRA